MGANDPRGMTNLDSCDMVGPSLHNGSTMYWHKLNIEAVGLKVLEKIFQVITIMSMEANDPQCMSMGDLCCHVNQSSNPISLKTLSISTDLMMLDITFDKNCLNDN